ncbi:MAG: YggT family protein [Anaerolineae bacterium]|jgi:YggT family protein|uniref:YggT family protein n=1 Tax=Candidatus Flexifilum breve TaxID=3140694 RepID=UPI001AC8C88C|nr:YggT family protein [Chloroflexota bacterium]MBK9750674.1 YggT family protein [Chloroflexota bacterium]MBN8635048.1 YggT family protein [Anaerolineae bacterium]
MNILITVLWLFELILLARVLMSWLPGLDRSHPIARFLIDVTEPILAPIRKALPDMGGFDFSPLIVFLIIQVLMQILV